jgi:hypothetical protein
MILVLIVNITFHQHSHLQLAETDFHKCETVIELVKNAPRCSHAIAITIIFVNETILLHRLSFKESYWLTTRQRPNE